MYENRKIKCERAKYQKKKKKKEEKNQDGKYRQIRDARNEPD